MLKYKIMRNKAKYSLKIHLIFVTKYRKQLLSNHVIDQYIKQQLLFLQTEYFSIDVLETDKDHVHMIISYSPSVSVVQIVRKLKQQTTVNIWKQMNLRRYYWKEKTFWSDGYFAYSIGDASTSTIMKYIEQQG